MSAKRRYRYTVSLALVTDDGVSYQVETGTESLAEPWNEDRKKTLRDRLAIAWDAVDSGEGETMDVLAAATSDNLRKMSQPVEWVRLSVPGESTVHEIVPED